MDDRIKRLKEKLLNAPYEICLERAKYFTEVYKQTKKEHPAIRNALALKKTLENQPIFIYDDEWIVGSKTGKFLAGVLSVERGDFLRVLQWEMDILEQKYRPFKIDDEDKKLFLNFILPYWAGRSVRDLKAKDWIKKGIIEPTNIFNFLKQTQNFLKFSSFIGRENLNKIAGIRTGRTFSFKRAFEALKVRDEISKNNPNMSIYCYDVQGHMTIGCDKVVKYGYRGLIEKAKEKLNSLKKNDKDYYNKSKFLEAVIISLESAIYYARRFSELAKRMSEAIPDCPSKDDSENCGEKFLSAYTNKRRLQRIYENLSNSPEFPARNFYEGIQATHFALLIGEIQYGMHDVLGIGRADQYLYQLYKKDIQDGNITKDEVIQLLQELNLKLTANVSLIPETGAVANGALGVSQHNVIIGGVDRLGNDATNELSYLMLEAYEDMKGAINQLSVRVHKGSPFEFVKRAIEVFRKASGIAFFNDDIIVPALVEAGCSIEDARDYTTVGCIETQPADCFPCAGGHEIVLPAILYFTLTNGQLPGLLPGQKQTIKSGDPTKFKNFEDFLTAFRKQLKHNIKILVKAVESKDKIYKKYMPSPYISALVDNCIESAKDMTSGGAKYDFTSINAHSLATTVDSIYTIKKLVFENKEISMKRLIKACIENYPDEKLRKKIINRLPKYGLDEPEVNEIASQIVQMFYEEVTKYKNIRGGRYRVGMYTYGNHIIDGFFLGATPDGRKKGEPTSNGISPTNGACKKGLTAVCNSVTKIGQSKLCGGVSFNVKIHPSNLKTNEGLEKITNLIISYFKMGGMHIQPNVVSNETLRDAQIHPENYRDLIVKVAGYSAYFTDLGKSIQDDIIAREEF